jgi:XRE family transcriptional regulator, regulator of sulfur utilization
VRNWRGTGGCGAAWRVSCPTDWRKVETIDKEADEPERAGLYLARNLISLRHARTLTQDALAAASALPRSTIANLESGEANPSLAVLVKVAGALGVPIDELLAAPRAKVRKWTAEEVGSRQRGQGIAERPLVPEPMPDGMLNIMDFAPGARLGGTPHLPGTREYFTCLDGRVGIVVAGHRHDLEAGDVLAFPGNIPHSYHNPDAKRPARGVSVVILAKAGV